MNLKREHCYCGNELIRISAQDHEGKMPLGYYCKTCKKMFDLGLIPLVNYKDIALSEPDPRMGFIRKLYPEMFMIILDKLQYNRCTCKIPDEIIDLESSLEDRLKKEAINLEKNFDNQVRQQEIKEAAEHQEFIK